MNLRTDFSSRQDLESYLHEQFPEAAGNLSPIPGGRRSGEETLRKFQAPGYEASRNLLSGVVSKLSPYIRHGLFTLREVLNQVRTAFPEGRLDKFAQELAWRDYWRRVHYEVGDGIWQDRERPKTGVAYSPDLPDNVGRTGLACMDAFAAELDATGYLHNHARMWMAAYVVHWQRSAWQAGAGWFLRHLLDGDPASNNLSWQWVASSFSHKPYFFNRENLEHCSEGRFCKSCPRNQDCPFDKTYPELAAELFNEEPRR